MRLYKIAVAIFAPVVRLLFRVRVTGAENIPEGAVMVCANHTSWLDPVVLAVGIGHRIPLHFMAKCELFRNPLLGYLLRKAGVIPVNREAVDLATMRACLSVLRENGKLMAFPEGTRIAEGKASRDNVKMGVGMLAIRGKAPLIPVYIPGNKRMFRKTHIVIGAPMAPCNAEGASGSENYMNTALAVFDEIMRLGQESRA